MITNNAELNNLLQRQFTTGQEVPLSNDMVSTTIP